MVGGFFCLGWLMPIVIVMAFVAIFQDIKSKNIAHPIIIVCGFIAIVSILDLFWILMADGEVPYFSYMLTVEPSHLNTIAHETLLFITFSYFGYLLVANNVSRRIKQEFVDFRLVDRYWYVFYLIGLFSMALWIYSTGGLSALGESFGRKYERSAGNGVLVAMTYFGHVAVLFWYRQNLMRTWRHRYSAIILLSAPFLLSGSRTELLIILIAAVYMDIQRGVKIKPIAVATAISVVTPALILYQLLRSQVENNDFWLAIYKDLSMQIGFLIAIEERVLGVGFHLDSLLLIFSTILPSSLKNAFLFPDAPSEVFTLTLFPWSEATFSMGLFGEAHYILPFGWAILYYFIGGFSLALIDKVSRTMGWSIIPAVMAGGAMRIAKGGYTVGFANVMQFVLPMLIIYSIMFLLNNKRSVAIHK